MITPNQIREKRIATVEGGGYDRDEVNELLLDVIESYEALYNENKELYRKMDVLANRIEEYRADEDSIKIALISAQKMASHVTTEAKEKAEKTIAESAASAHQTVVDAQAKADKIVGEAREYVAGLTKEKAQAADQIVAEAEKKANDAISGAKLVGQNVLSQAAKLAEEIVSNAENQKDYYSQITAKLKVESKEFISVLTALYEEQLDKLKGIESSSVDTSEAEGNIANLKSELGSLMDSIAEVVGVQEEAEQNSEEAEEISEVSENEAVEEDTEESEVVDDTDVSDPDYDEVDEIIEEIESMESNAEFDKEEYQPEDVDDAIDAFSSDEITPVEENLNSIPVIEDEPEFESAMPFESFFNVSREDIRTDETISLLPPEDEEEEDNSKFKGFFKKKK